MGEKAEADEMGSLDGLRLEAVAGLKKDHDPLRFCAGAAFSSF